VIYLAVIVILAGIYLIDSGVKNRAPIGFLQALISDPNPDFRATLDKFNGEWTPPIGEDSTPSKSGANSPEKGNVVGLPNQFSERNGNLPSSGLVTLSWNGIRVAKEAAPSLELLNKAFRSRFNRNLSVTDGYRTFAQQRTAKALKGNLAATPGTSNHGLGLAVDLGGGVNSYNTQEYGWMLLNAGKWGWVNPTWAQRGGSKPEPWHWEFVGA
jgi:hypothetical protein